MIINIILFMLQLNLFSGSVHVPGLVWVCVLCEVVLRAPEPAQSRTRDSEFRWSGLRSRIEIR